MPFSLSCDRSSQETLKITLFYQPGRLVKISWKSLDISSNDMSGCRFWLDFQEKFAFNCEKCYSNHCNYRGPDCLEKRVTLYNYRPSWSLAPSCKPAELWSLYGWLSAVRMVTVDVSEREERGCHMSASWLSSSAAMTDYTDNIGLISRLVYGSTRYYKSSTITGIWCRCW